MKDAEPLTLHMRKQTVTAQQRELTLTRVDFFQQLRQEGDSTYGLFTPVHTISLNGNGPFQGQHNILQCIPTSMVKHTPPTGTVRVRA
jgi:hypothetical protein